MNGVRLRPARADDADLLLEWRNDPVTRQASLDQGEVDPVGHVAWLARRLVDPDTRLMIVEHAGLPTGQVRLDRVDETSAEVSIGLAPSARGRGLGGTALALLESETWPEITELHATVRVDNTASLRAFEGVGYTERSRDGDVRRLVKQVRGPARR